MRAEVGTAPPVDRPAADGDDLLVSRFASAARLVLASTAESSGHAWIAFHRCVEAHSRLTGERFSSVFARLGAAHGFTRQARVDVPTLQAATRDLVLERESLLRERQRLIGARRAEKRAGRRANTSPALRDLEARHRAATALQPAVGCWGWQALREGHLGPRLPLAVPDAPPAFGGTGQRVFVDLRERPVPGGLAEALSVALSGGRADRLWLLLAPGQLVAWTTWAEGSAGAACLHALGRKSWGGSAVLVVCPHPLSPGEEVALRALASALPKFGWRLCIASATVPR